MKKIERCIITAKLEDKYDWSFLYVFGSDNTARSYSLQVDCNFHEMGMTFGKDELKTDFRGFLERYIRRHDGKYPRYYRVTFEASNDRE